MTTLAEKISADMATFSEEQLEKIAQEVERQKGLASLERGVDDYKNSRMRPAEDVFADLETKIQQKHGVL